MKFYLDRNRFTEIIVNNILYIYIYKYKNMFIYKI